MNRVLNILIAAAVILGTIPSVKAQSGDSTRKIMLAPRPGASPEILQKAEKINRTDDSLRALGIKPTNNSDISTDHSNIATPPAEKSDTVWVNPEEHKPLPQNKQKKQALPNGKKPDRIP